MLLLNFAHPLSEAQKDLLQQQAGQPVQRVIEAKAQFDHQRPFAAQVTELKCVADRSLAQVRMVKTFPATSDAFIFGSNVTDKDALVSPVTLPVTASRALVATPAVLPMLTVNGVGVALAANVRFPCTDNGPAIPG